MSICFIKRSFSSPARFAPAGNGSAAAFDGYSTVFRQWKAEDTHCRFLHGYAISFRVWFEGELDHRNWVWDFGGMKRSKTQINGMSPKFYRKSLVEMTKVVETNMCAKDWDSINFSHVPSVAASRYKKAFNRNTPTYAAYVASLVKGDNPDVKVNAGAVFPYDVLKGRISGYTKFDKTELDLVQKQWEALPNFVGDANILPLVDVSGSMSCAAGGHGSKSGLTCMEVAVSLGLYLADKNEGKFKDTFLTFSDNPELLHLKGNINQKIDQMVKSNWAMSTNLHKAFKTHWKLYNTPLKIPKQPLPSGTANLL